MCGTIIPSPTSIAGADTFRNFVADPLIVRDSDGNVIRRIIPDDLTVTTVTEDTPGWEKIDGATLRSYTPHYDARVGGTVSYLDAVDSSITAPPQPRAVYNRGMDRRRHRCHHNEDTTIRKGLRNKQNTRLGSRQSASGPLLRTRMARRTAPTGVMTTPTPP